jgi:hypothetical protein
MPQRLHASPAVRSAKKWGLVKSMPPSRGWEEAMSTGAAVFVAILLLLDHLGVPSDHHPRREQHDTVRVRWRASDAMST